MELIKFSSQLGGKDPTQPPFRIPAKDLDSNFAKLKPLASDGNNRQYAINETPDGWFLTLFPDTPEALSDLGSGSTLVPPPPASGTYVLGSQNGTVVWLATEACP